MTSGMAVTCPVARLQRYVRESSHWPARRFRQWALDRKDLNADIMRVQWVIVWGIAILVFLLIGFAETVHQPAQLGLP